MASSTVVIVVHIYCQADQLENIHACLKKLIDATRTEPGCIEYNLHEDLSDATHLTLLEQWTNEEALQLHFQTEHFKEATGYLNAFYTKPIKIFKYKKIG